MGDTFLIGGVNCVLVSMGSEVSRGKIKLDVVIVEEIELVVGVVGEGVTTETIGVDGICGGFKGIVGGSIIDVDCSRTIFSSAFLVSFLIFKLNLF